MSALFVLVQNLASLLCFAGAAWLAHDGRGGWGWFLFAGIVCFCCADYNASDSDPE